MADQALKVRLTVYFWVHDQGRLEAYILKLQEAAGEEPSYLSLEDAVYEAVVGMTPVTMTPGAGFLDIGLEMQTYDCQIIGGRCK